MGKKGTKARRVNINFRQTARERSGTWSYKNFGKFFKEKFKNIYDKN